MSNKLKVAIYSGDIPSTTFIERLVLGLARNGCEVFLFGFFKNKVSHPTGVRVVGYHNTKFGKLCHLLWYSFLLTLFRYRDKKKLDRLLQDHNSNHLKFKVKAYPVLWHRPDMFHLQWAKGLKDWMWVQDFGIKLVLSLRGAHINYSPIADTELAESYTANFPKVDGFHAVSNAIASKAIHYGAPNNNISVIYSGLDMETFQVLKSTNHADIFQIVSVGRPHWIKGYHYALGACHILKQRGIQFNYTIVGGAGDLELLYQVRDLGLEMEVTLLPHKPYEAVKQLIKDASVLLLPSVEEGVANVVLEAMALGTLVLSTNCGGMAEVIESEVNGFLVPIRNPDAIARKLIHIMELSKIDKQHITAEALDTVNKKHQMDVMISRMIRLYRQVLNDSNHAHKGNNNNEKL